MSRVAGPHDHGAAIAFLRMLTRLAGILALLTVLTAPGRAVSQGVAGRVVSADGGRTLAGVAVTLLDARGEPAGSVVTGEDGTFRMRVGQLGWYRLHASHSAWQDSAIGPLQLAPDRLIGATIRLRPAEFRLGPLRAGEAPPSPGAGATPAAGAAAVDGLIRLDSATIAALRVRRLTDLLATLDGVRLADATGSGGERLALVGDACVPRIQLDGHVVAWGGRAELSGARVTVVHTGAQRTPPADHAPDHFATPARLRLAEVYLSPATVPVRPPNAPRACALIVLRSG